MKFDLQSSYRPSGDQPEAIDGLCKALQDGVDAVTLLGVTGSGKTFTMANVIQRLQRPALILSHNKTLAAQLYGEFKAFLPAQRRGVFRLLLRLLPAGGLHPHDRHLYREGPEHQRQDRRTPRERRLRPDVGTPGRHRHLVRLLPVRHRQSGRLPRPDRHGPQGGGHVHDPAPVQDRGRPLLPDGDRVQARFLPRPGRHRGHFPRRRRLCRPDRILRRRGGQHLAGGSRDGRPVRGTGQDRPVSGEELRHLQGEGREGGPPDPGRPHRPGRVFREHRQVPGGQAPQAAGGVRHRDDQGDGLLPRAWRTIPAISTAASPASAPSP